MPAAVQPKISIERMIEMRRDGAFYGDISLVAGITADHVSALLRPILGRTVIAAPAPSVDPDELRVAATQTAPILSFSDLCLKFGVGHDYMRRRLRELGIVRPKFDRSAAAIGIAFTTSDVREPNEEKVARLMGSIRFDSLPLKRGHVRRMQRPPTLVPTGSSAATTAGA